MEIALKKSRHTEGRETCHVIVFFLHMNIADAFQTTCLTCVICFPSIFKKHWNGLLAEKNKQYWFK